MRMCGDYACALTDHVAVQGSWGSVVMEGGQRGRWGPGWIKFWGKVYQNCVKYTVLKYTGLADGVG